MVVPPLKTPANVPTVRPVLQRAKARSLRHLVYLAAAISPSNKKSCYFYAIFANNEGW